MARKSHGESAAVLELPKIDTMLESTGSISQNTQRVMPLDPTNKDFELLTFGSKRSMDSIVP